MINKSLIKISSITLVNVILGFLITRWLCVHVDFNLIVNELRELDQSSIVLSVLLGISLYLVYGLRMALLLDIDFIASTQIIIMGFGLNACLPFRLGDVFKILFAKQFYKIDLTKTSFATVIEKGMDLAVISLLALIFIFRNSKYYLALFLLFLVISFLFMKFKRTTVLIHNHYINESIAVIKLILSKNKRKAIICCTLGIWVLTLLVFYIFFNGNIKGDVPFTILEAIILLIYTTLSLAIPSMPAGIGLFESGIVYYLTYHFHLSAEKAVTYAFIYHLIIVIPQVIFTGVILFINIVKSPKLRSALHGT